MNRSRTLVRAFAAVALAAAHTCPSPAADPRPQPAHYLFSYFVKDETNKPLVPQKNIRVAFAERALGPFGPPSPPITGDYWAEGPTPLRIGEKWFVYFDKYRQKKSGVCVSTDLVHWIDHSDRLEMPDGRKHIKQTPTGRVLTEFIVPVKHAGDHNTISCAFGHHLAEGRWLRDLGLLDEYTYFWYRGGEYGAPVKHFHKYSSWAAAALYDRYLVTGDRQFAVDLLDDLIADYRAWEAERGQPDGLFWQYDVKDGMEESISGGRRAQNIRPTINSYMAANARAIAHIAKLAGRPDEAHEFHVKAETISAKMIDALWDADAHFFKVRFPDGRVSDAREAIGFIPWMFDLAKPEHAQAWLQIKDPNGFWAPWGLTTAERRHPGFRSHGTGTCEWDGAVWPFATSQTLRGLANVLRGPEQPYVSRRDFFRALVTYARAHQQDGKAYIGEYHDETTGEWLITGVKAARSRYYNHSTFADHVIGGLVGMVPRDDDIVEIDPLVPEDTWDWFCLDGVPYHGRLLSVVWDRFGKRYGRGTGFAILADDHEIARSATLSRITGKLPAHPQTQ